MRRFFSPTSARTEPRTTAKVCSIGLSRDDVESFLTQLDRSGQSPSLGAHDYDDGKGNDAWLIYRAEATGSH